MFWPQHYLHNLINQKHIVMSFEKNQPRREFLRSSATIVAGVAGLASLLPSLSANAGGVGRIITDTPVTEAGFRMGVMPRAQLSILASQLAVEKATQLNAKEFAGFELEEAIAVVNVLQSFDTPTKPADDEAMKFIAKLKAASGNEFDRLYMQAELSNHEWLRDLASTYLGTATNHSMADREVRRIATLALFAFHEHVALCKRIYGEVSA